VATQKESTLQIKQFKGRDTFTEGTQQEPDVFEVIQNMEVDNPGELKAINGVTRLNEIAPSAFQAITNVDKILHAKFLNTPKEKGLFLLCEEDYSNSDPSPPGVTFSTSGGGAANYDVYVQGIDSVGNKANKFTPVSIQANGLTVTFTNPDNFPRCRSINIFIGTVGATGAALIWSGSVYRKVDGTFPTSVTVFPPLAATPSIKSVPYFAGTFTASSASGGTLDPDRVYYFGLGPWFKAVGATDNIPSNIAECSLYSGGSAGSNGVQVMSGYVRSGYNALDFTFDFCPYEIPDGSTAPISAEMVQTKVCVFFGITPEDLMPVGNSDGISIPWTKTQVTTSVSTASVVLAADTIATAYNIPVGALIKYNVGTGSVTGLVDGSYYWVVSSSGGVIKLSATAGGAAVDLTAVVAGNFNLRWSKVTGTVKHVPHSTDRGCSAYRISDVGNVVPVAGTGRYYAGYVPYYYNQNTFRLVDTLANRIPTTESGLTGIKKTFGIYFKEKTFNPNLRKDCFAPVFNPAVNVYTYGWDLSLNSSDYHNFGGGGSDEMQSRLFGNRIWMVDGVSEPFYTNGYVLKSGTPTKNASADTYQRWPITKYIEFFKGKMILTSSSGNQSFNQGYVYYSSDNVGGFPDITYFHMNTTTPRQLALNTSDQSDIVGLNVYSQDLSNVGAESFLVVGKKSSVFVWSGDTTTAPKQISKATGFAGPNCFSLTKFGPIFVGTDNVYLFRTSQDVIPIGYGVRDIILGLSKTELYNVNVVYHKENVKIAYTDSSHLDKEIWLKLIQQGGGINNIWTGPHTLASFDGQTIIDAWDSEEDYRLSYINVTTYENYLQRRDDPGSFLNEGQNITRRLKIRNLGLQADQLLKLITRLHLGLRLTADETFDMTLDSQDGSQSIVVKFDVTNTGNSRQMKQVIVPQRWLTRVLTLTLENTNNSDISIYDFSILFQSLRRRQLP
jgi:hypothetical protein